MGISITAVDSVLACAVCLGAPGHATTLGMNMAIGVMLMFVTSVLGGIIAFIVYLGRKARQAEALERAGAFDLAE